MKSGENDRGPTAALHWFSLQDDNCSDAVNCLLDISTPWQDIAVSVKRQVFAQYTKCLLDTELLVYWISPLAFELWQVIMTWVINTGHNKYPLHALCSLSTRHARDVCRCCTIVSDGTSTCHLHWWPALRIFAKQKPIVKHRSHVCFQHDAMMITW